MTKFAALILVLVFLAQPALAEEPNFVIGIGGAVADFQDEIGEEDDPAPSAQMVADRKLVPMAQIMTVPSPIFNVDGLRWLRWSVELGAYPFRVHKQVEDRVGDVVGSDKHNLGNEVDMDTEIKGFIGYLNPTISLFHRFSESIYAFIGFGYGAGYAAVKGDYYVTSGPDAGAACLSANTLATIKANCELREVTFDKFATGSNAMFGVSIGPVGIRYSRGGPTFKDGRYQHKAIGSLGAIFLQFGF